MTMQRYPQNGMAQNTSPADQAPITGFNRLLQFFVALNKKIVRLLLFNLEVTIVPGKRSKIF